MPAVPQPTSHSSGKVQQKCWKHTLWDWLPNFLRKKPWNNYTRDILDLDIKNDVPWKIYISNRFWLGVSKYVKSQVGYRYTIIWAHPGAFFFHKTTSLIDWLVIDALLLRTHRMVSWFSGLFTIHLGSLSTTTPLNYPVVQGNKPTPFEC